MKFAKLLCIVFCLSSCILIHIDDSIDLGGKYRFIQDYPQTIIYHETEEYEGGGRTVVEPLVTSYRFNNRYIIAISNSDYPLKNAVSKRTYWIVDKQESSVEAMDSLEFYQVLKDREIGLSFTRLQPPSP